MTKKSIIIHQADQRQPREDLQQPAPNTSNLGDSNEADLFGDFGNIEMPDLDGVDLSLIDFLPSDEAEEARYTFPKFVSHAGEEFVLYNNAVKLAKELKVTEGMRADAFVGGNFIFGDFIEAFLHTHNAKAERMTISTLSLNQENIDSLAGLMRQDYIGELNIVASAYFYVHERNALVPYLYQQLDKGNRFQLAVADVHTKTIHFETLGGKKIVIHGSANMRSSNSIEQFTIEENPELYEFYETQYNKLIEKYATIRKPIRNPHAWDVFTRKYFKDQ